MVRGARDRRPATSIFEERLSALRRRLSTTAPPCVPSRPSRSCSTRRPRRGMSTRSPSAGERIAAGEIFQANLCLRLDSTWDGGAAALSATALERISPPYAAMFDTPDGSVASLSPELFLRRRGDQVLTAPIKGTIARTGDPDADAAALRTPARLGQGRGRARDDRRPDAQRHRARVRVRVGGGAAAADSGGPSRPLASGLTRARDVAAADDQRGAVARDVPAGLGHRSAEGPVAAGDRRARADRA